MIQKYGKSVCPNEYISQVVEEYSHATTDIR